MYGAGRQSPSHPRDIPLKAPQRLIAAGPYGRDVCLVERLGACTLTMKAGRLFVRKPKTFGFENALLKRVVAKDLHLSLMRDGQRLVELNTAKLEMPPGMTVIRIEHPTLIYPQGEEAPEMVRIDKGSRTLTLQYPGSTQTLSLGP